MTAMYKIYHCNPHVRIDVPDIFIFSQLKYFVLSIDPQIRKYHFNVKVFFIFLTFVLNRMFAFYGIFHNTYLDIFFNLF